MHNRKQNTPFFKKRQIVIPGHFRKHEKRVIKKVVEFVIEDKISRSRTIHKERATKMKSNQYMLY